MPTHWNTVGKVKNTKLYNFCLVRLFHSLHSIRPSLSKSRGNVATSYLFHVPLRTFTRETTATHVQLSQASSNHVIERWASSVYRYSQSFSTVKRKQITVPRVELTAITWHRAVCNCFHGYGWRAWHFADPVLNYAESVILLLYQLRSPIKQCMAKFITGDVGHCQNYFKKGTLEFNWTRFKLTNHPCYINLNCGLSL